MLSRSLLLSGHNAIGFILGFRLPFLETELKCKDLCQERIGKADESTGERKSKGRGKDEGRKKKGRGKEEERKRKGRGREDRKGSVSGCLIPSI